MYFVKRGGRALSIHPNLHTGLVLDDDFAAEKLLAVQ